MSVYISLQFLKEQQGHFKYFLHLHSGGLQTRRWPSVGKKLTKQTGINSLKTLHNFCLKLDVLKINLDTRFPISFLCSKHVLHIFINTLSHSFFSFCDKVVGFVDGG